MASTRGKIILVFLTGIFGVYFSGVALAQHGHDHGTPSKMDPKAGESHEILMKSRPVQSVTVEGLKISFEVMSMAGHMKHMPIAKGGSHSEVDHSKSHMFMVTLQDTVSKEIISDAKLNFTILTPSGEKEIGKMEWSGDHYGAGFGPKEKGTYQIELKIESVGMEREAKFTYEAKG